MDSVNYGMNCDLCGEVFGIANGGFQVFMYNKQNNSLIKTKKSHTCCLKCYNLNKEIFNPGSGDSGKNIEKIKTIISSNSFLENRIYDIIDDHLFDLNGGEVEDDAVIYSFEDYAKKRSQKEEFSSRKEIRNPEIFDHPRENPSKVIRKKGGSENSILDKMLTPKEIFNELKKTVKGQDQALMDLSVATFMYLSSLRNPEANKINIVIMGSTGTGKTQMVESLSKFLDIPMTSFNTGHLTPAGYKGDNVPSIAEKIISIHGEKKGATSILYLDEIDKLMCGNGSSEDLKKSVQQELLKVLEGGDIVTSDSGGKRETICFPTRNLFIIASGAFPEIERRKNKTKTHKAVGLNSLKSKSEDIDFCFSSITGDDLIEGGFIPEFVGRFSMITSTKKITTDVGMSILRDSNQTPLKNYEILFKNFNSEIIFTDEFLLKNIVIPGIEENTGARGFRKKLDSIMTEHVFNVDRYIGKKLVIKSDSFDVINSNEDKFDRVI